MDREIAANTPSEKELEKRRARWRSRRSS
jgi:hypothetical protein